MTKHPGLEAEASPLRATILDIALNTVIPVLLYSASKRWISPSEFTALVVATLYPLGESVFGLSRHRRLDPIALVVLGGIGFDAAAIFLGGSPKLLLVRESAFTGAFGVACFASLLLRRPLMFYFARQFMAGNDEAKLARYEASWALPEVRHGQRLVTAVWGAVFVGELAVRLLLIFTLTPEAVLLVSPTLIGVATVITLAWSLRYGKRMRARVLHRL